MRSTFLAALILFTGCFAPPSDPDPAGPGAVEPVTVERWPSFRGPGASGVADGQHLPLTWDGQTGANVLWQVRIPGLAHASPVVWGDTIYLTTAISSRGEAGFKPGLYGDGTASDDRSVHRWVVLAIDAESGATRWERTAHTGVPTDKRHIKATYANSTPATDGEHVVALFGSEGLFAFDADGERLWHVELGRLDAGAYDAPDYEWGSASSPIIHDGTVFVQCDTQATSFVQAIDVDSGETLWRVERDEPPSWGTPTVVPWPDGDVLVTNASRFIRGYDPATGEQLWRLGGSSMITAPTPIYTETGMVIVASGRRPEKPIFAVRPGAHGDITLGDGVSANEFVAWSHTKRGPYMPTPLVYRGRLYSLNNDGVFDCYDMSTGEEVYRERVPHQGSGFSASPVAADGYLFLPGEDGDVFVVKAGPKFELVATNSVPDTVMATPAIAHGRLYLRSRDYLWAIGEP